MYLEKGFEIHKMGKATAWMSQSKYFGELGKASKLGMQLAQNMRFKNAIIETRLKTVSGFD